MFLNKIFKFNHNCVKNLNLTNLFTKTNQRTNLKSKFYSSILPNNKDSNDIIICKKFKPWTQKEIDILIDAVKTYGTKWKYISKECFQSSRNSSSLSLKWRHINQYRSSYYDKWTAEEDKVLNEGVEKYGVGKWAEISKMVTSKNNAQIAVRWNLISNKKRGRWEKEEDENLLDLIDKHGRKWTMISTILNRPRSSIAFRYRIITSDPWTPKENIKLRNAISKYNQDWNEIQKLFPNRHLTDIKIRYQNCPSTNPYVNLGRWSQKEVDHLLQAFEEFGNQWKIIANIVKTRSPSQCAKYWNLHFKKQEENAYRIY